MDDQNKNLILATALSFLVILVWLILFPPPEEQLPPPGEALSGEVATTASGAPAPAAPRAGDAAATQTSPATTAEPQADTPRIAIRSAHLEGSLSLAGGRIDELSLKDYRQTLEPESPTVTLLRHGTEGGAYYAVYGWAPGGDLASNAVPGPSTLWELESGGELTPETPITLKWDNGAGLVFRREVALDENYMFRITQSVANNTQAPVRLAPYGILSRFGEPQDMKNFFILHEGLISMADGELTETDYDAMTDFEMNPREGGQAESRQVNEGGWIGFTDHYWMATLIGQPDQPFRTVAKYDARHDIYQAEAVQSTREVAPGARAEVVSQLFAGPKEWETIRAYQNEGGVARFIDSIDWGWFFFITKPMFAVLHWLNKIIGNMGWSIIALTLLIKALLIPLAYKSYSSMARMKELQPEMEKLKERTGDDRQKFQQEMMALYKKEKVNPASGCLPILVQIPIFFSLYKVIFVTLELRHAPWLGWIRDLSAPDPSSILNLFGLLPYAAPEPGSILALISLGILPIILGISMWLQQKLNPAPTDPTQAMIFAWMPWVFMFMLGSFASGLVLYWIANNLITFTQQYIIMRSHGYKPDVLGNILRSVKREKKEG